MTLGEKTFLGPIETNSYLEAFRAILGPKKNFKEPLKDDQAKVFLVLPSLFIF